MPDLPIRKFTTVVSFLTEPTYITNDGEVIGQFLPKAWLDKVPVIKLGEVTNRPGVDLTGYKGAEVSVTGGVAVNMDDVKKAIEPDKVKVSERPGKPPELSKGLGDIPGVTRSDPSFGHSRPAPKPGKSK